MIKKFIIEPKQILEFQNHPINIFENIEDNGNLDETVIKSFGEEWQKFHDFDDAEIDRLGKMYFDILDENMVNHSSYVLDVGCGTARWTKYLADKVNFIEAIDPSDAILTADKLLGDIKNVRLSKASTDTIPFADETFDFVMSIGVLHHIPDTQKAMSDCVKKVRIGGYFYVYLYYNLENKGFVFRFLLKIVTQIRKRISSLPTKIKKIACDFIAVFIYMPIILLGRAIKVVGFPSVASKIPLNIYQNQSFYIIRNDALDRFGTSLEQRFSKIEVRNMMEKAGLTEIVIADTLPYWHAVGKRTH